MRRGLSRILLLVLCCGGSNGATADQFGSPAGLESGGTKVISYGGLADPYADFFLTSYYPETRTVLMNSAGQQTLIGELVTHQNTWENCPSTSVFPYASEYPLPTLPFMLESQTGISTFVAPLATVKIGTPVGWGSIGVSSLFTVLPTTYSQTSSGYHEYNRILASGKIRAKGSIFFDDRLHSYDPLHDAEFTGIVSTVADALVAGTFTWHSDIYQGDNLYCSYRLFMMQSAVFPEEPFSLVRTLRGYVSNLVSEESRNTARKTRNTCMCVRG